MMDYADYCFYMQEYKGSMPQELFYSYITKASRIIDDNINRDLTECEINKLSLKDQYRLKYVACELCDFVKATGGNTSGGTESIAIDGVVINKPANSETTKLKNKELIINGLPHELIRFL